MRLAIIGAGISGLACADVLARNGMQVVLFDKSRGVGGRMATRRIKTPAGVVSLDHGAQYFTVRTPAFREQVDAWAALGIARPWSAASPDAWVGHPSMTAPARHMAERHAICAEHHVRALLRSQGAWWVRDRDHGQGPFDGVVLALPADQAAVFLAMHDLAMAREAIAARSQPCWTAMCVFDRRLDIEADILRDRGSIAWACRNNARPGRNGPEAWVIQASGTWSAANLELEAGVAAQLLLEALLGGHCAGKRPVVLSLTGHRWRYAMTRGNGQTALWNDALAIGACGDWLLGPRVELAWQSGRALGERIVKAFG